MSESGTRLYILEGACSTGKTTLIQQYHEQNPDDVRIVPESARRYFETHSVPLEDRYTLETQGNIQDACISAIDDAMNEAPPVVLADTSPIAAVAYASLSDSEMADKLFERIEGWFVQVALFFLLNPHDIEYKLDPADPVRKETPEQRMAVHRALMQYIQAADIPMEVIRGTLDERKRQIDALIFR